MHKCTLLAVVHYEHCTIFELVKVKSYGKGIEWFKALKMDKAVNLKDRLPSTF